MPTRRAWIRYGYNEIRDDPVLPFVSGRTYAYPTGDSPIRANCLKACGAAYGNPASKSDFSDYLTCGFGRFQMSTIKAGVNSFFDTGANAREWAGLDHRGWAATMGGSWWYGTAQMRADYDATNSHDMPAVYIGFGFIGD